MSQANDTIKYQLELDTAIAQSAAGTAEPIASASGAASSATAVTPFKRPQKLKDFPLSVQALMPNEWDKEADIFSPVPAPIGIDPSKVATPGAGRGLHPEVYQNNYFMWAIFNDQKLARGMIVAGVDTNVREVHLRVGNYTFGRQSPLFAALYHSKDGLLVESLGMADTDFDISIGGGTAMCARGQSIQHYLEDGRPLLGILYNKSQIEYLSIPEQALLRYVHFATPTEAQLSSVIASNADLLIPRELFQIIFNYAYDSTLREHLETADHQISTGTPPVIERSSLIERFHGLAEEYRHNTRRVQLLKEEYDRAQRQKEENELGKKSVVPVTVLFQNQSAAAAVNPSSAQVAEITDLGESGFGYRDC
jgi:hypothetical protein